MTKYLILGVLMVLAVPAVAWGQGIQPADCTAAPPFQLRIGEQAIVQQNLGDPVNVRRGPSVEADVVGQVTEGSVVTVLDGPYCGEDDRELYAWYLVDLGGGIEAWIAEGDSSRNRGIYFVAPTDLSAVPPARSPAGVDVSGRAAYDPGCPVSYPTFIRAGDTAAVADIGNPIRLRAEIDGEVVGELSPNTQLTVLENAVCGDTYAWFRVQTEDGRAGYVAQGDDSQNPRAEFITLLEAALAAAPATSGSAPSAELCATTFAAGSNATVAQRVFVYTEPLLTADVVATVEPGNALLLQAGPLCGESGLWWKVRLGDGASGWAQEQDPSTTYLTP